MRGASQIVLMSRHQDRQQMALESGATAVVAERGEEGIAKVREILGGGADAASNVSVQKQLSIKLSESSIMVDVWVLWAFLITIIVPLVPTFAQNISVAGGAASVTTYDKQVLLKAVLDGDINPGRVFTQAINWKISTKLIKDMDERKTIKAMIVIN